MDESEYALDAKLKMDLTSLGFQGTPPLPSPHDDSASFPEKKTTDRLPIR